MADKDGRDFVLRRGQLFTRERAENSTELKKVMISAPTYDAKLTLTLDPGNRSTALANHNEPHMDYRGKR